MEARKLNFLAYLMYGWHRYRLTGGKERHRQTYRQTEAAVETKRKQRERELETDTDTETETETDSQRERPKQKKHESMKASWIHRLLFTIQQSRHRTQKSRELGREVDEMRRRVRGQPQHRPQHPTNWRCIRSNACLVMATAATRDPQRPPQKYPD